MSEGCESVGAAHSLQCLPVLSLARTAQWLRCGSLGPQLSVGRSLWTPLVRDLPLILARWVQEDLCAEQGTQVLSSVRTNSLDSNHVPPPSSPLDKERSRRVAGCGVRRE